MAQINKPSQPLVPPTDIEDVEGIVNEAIASDTTHAPLVNDLVPAVNLPSYVDDVLEFDSVESFPNPGEEGKIYVALDTNYTYRWAGSVYTQVGGSEVDLSDYYRKEEVNELLDEKADAADLASLDNAVSSLESDLAVDEAAIALKADSTAVDAAIAGVEAEIALKANAADSVEVIPYQNQTPLTQEQINKALAGKLAIFNNGRVYVPHYHSEAMVNFHCFEIGHNISDSQNVSDTMRSMEYVIILLIETGMLSDSGPMPVSSIGDYANNYLAMADAPVADGKRLIREGNLVANYYDKTDMDDSLRSKADARSVYTKSAVDDAIAAVEERVDDLEVLVVDLIVDEQTEHGMSGHVDNKAAALLLENPDRPVRFQLNGILVSPQIKSVDNGLEYNVMTGGPENTSYIHVFVSEESNSWELTMSYGIDTLTNGLVDAQNDITALQDNVTELQGNVTELQEALPLNVDASGTVAELTGEILGHGVFQELQPPEEGPFTPGAYCEYYNSNNEQVWYMQMLEGVYNQFLNTLIETVPSSITIRNDDADWAKLQLTSFKSDVRIAESGYITNTYVYSGIFTDSIARRQYSITLRLVSNNGQSLSSDIISTPILKPSQVENLVQSAIGDVLNTDF